MARLFLATLIRNSDWILNDWLRCVQALDLDIPKKDIEMCFLVNDSVDSSADLLESFCEQHRSEYGQLILARQDLGKKAIGAGSSRINECDPLNRRTGEGPEARVKLFRNLAHLRNMVLAIYKERSEAPWLVSIDSDVLVEPDTVSRLIGDGSPRMCGAMVVNDYLLANGKSFEFYHRRCNAGIVMDIHGRRTLAHLVNYQVGKVYPVAVTGACFAIHRSLAFKSAYDFHQWGEDAAYCLGLPEGSRIEWDTNAIPFHVMDLALLGLLDEFDKARAEARAECL